ncbi:MAG: SurA N-terminal domain-containing protein [Patescibacteria group bacterium]
MATQKRVQKKTTVNKQSMIHKEIPSVVVTPKFNTKLLYMAVGLLALLALVLANKSVFLAAVVGSKPVFSWELNRVLVDRYGKQTLEGMISEQLIANEAKKQNISVSSGDIKSREEEIVKGLGSGMPLEELLKIQGLSKEEFDRQITLQLTVQKILGKDLVITQDDIDMFIASNRATLVATEEASLRVEAKQAILDSKIGEKLQPWFNELKTKAKILRFL